MRFGFSDDQRELAGAVRDILSSELTADVRAAGAEASGRRGSVWKSLGEAGVFGLLVPEELDGLGMTELDAVLVLEELGRAAVPGPIAETAFVAAPFLAAEAVGEAVPRGSRRGRGRCLRRRRRRRLPRRTPMSPTCCCCWTAMARPCCPPTPD